MTETLSPSQPEPADDLNRRLKVVRIHRELLAGIFKTGKPDTYLRCVEGLPEDAELVGISEQTYFLSDEIALKFRSKEFPVAQPGSTLMTAHPLYSCVTVSADELKLLDEWRRVVRKGEAAENPSYRDGLGTFTTQAVQDKIESLLAEGADFTVGAATPHVVAGGGA